MKVWYEDGSGLRLITVPDDCDSKVVLCPNNVWKSPREVLSERGIDEKPKT